MPNIQKIGKRPILMPRGLEKLTYDTGVAYFEAAIEHGDVTPENVVAYRKLYSSAKSDMALGSSFVPLDDIGPANWRFPTSRNAEFYSLRSRQQRFELFTEGKALALKIAIAETSDSRPNLTTPKEDTYAWIKPSIDVIDDQLFVLPEESNIKSPPVLCAIAAMKVAVYMVRCKANCLGDELSLCQVYLQEVEKLLHMCAYSMNETGQTILGNDRKYVCVLHFVLELIITGLAIGRRDSRSPCMLTQHQFVETGNTMSRAVNNLLYVEEQIGIA